MRSGTEPRSSSPGAAGWARISMADRRRRLGIAWMALTASGALVLLAFLGYGEKLAFITAALAVLGLAIGLILTM